MTWWRERGPCASRDYRDGQPSVARSIQNDLPLEVLDASTTGGLPRSSFIRTGSLTAKPASSASLPTYRTNWPAPATSRRYRASTQWT